MPAFLLRTLCVSVVLLGLGIFVVHQSQPDRVTQQRLAAAEQLHKHDRRLDQLVEFNFGKPVTLDDWVKEWSRQTEIEAEIGEAYSLTRPPTGQQKISLDLPPMSAREALQALCESDDLHWAIAGDGRILIDCQDDRPSNSTPSTIVHVETATYHLPQCLVGKAHTSLADLLHTGTGWSDTWYSGAGDIIDGHGELTVVNHHDMQLRVAQFLKSLTATIERSSSVPLAGTSADDPRFLPVLLNSEPARSRELQHLLDQPMDLDFAETPLPEFARQLSAQTGFPFRVNVKDFQEVGLDPNLGITCRARQMKLRHALDFALGSHELRLQARADGRLLTICADFSRYELANLETFAYPVGDLLPSAPESQRYHELIRAIRQVVEPGSWESGTHWSGPCQISGFQNLLVATISWREHWKIHEFLTSLRRVRSGQHGSRLRSGFDTKPSHRLLKACERKVALDYQAPLELIAIDLWMRCELPIWVSPKVREDFPLSRKITCDIQARPLRENLDRLLRPLNLRAALRPEYLEIVVADHDYEDGLVTDVFDLRTLGGHWNRSTITQLIEKATSPDEWSHRGGPAVICFVGDTLVIRHEAPIVDRVIQLLQSQAARVQPEASP